ncbi:MAG: Coq4 family protein [Bacteroidota bacterium]
MNIREKICVLLFEKSKLPYARIFKRQKTPWNLSVENLLLMNQQTLGHSLGQFLSRNHFSLIPRLERHDAYHVLTGYGTEVKDEIALQFLCFGNGKRSKYLWMVMTVGTLLNPEYWSYFKQSYVRGKRARQFYHWDFKDYLQRDLASLQKWVFDGND